MSIRILKIRKPLGQHPHEAIQALEWINEQTGETGRVEREALYDWIRKGGKAYVRDSQRDVAYV